MRTSTDDDKVILVELAVVDVACDVSTVGDERCGSGRSEEECESGDDGEGRGRDASDVCDDVLVDVGHRILTMWLCYPYSLYPPSLPRRDGARQSSLESFPTQMVVSIHTRTEIKENTRI